MPCPHLFDFSALPATFQHVAGQTSCPQLVASPTLTNTSTSAVSYNATVTGTSALSWGNATGTVQPGGSTTLQLSFNCSTTSSFNAMLQVRGTPAGGGPSQTITSPISAQISIRAVRLNHALGPYPAGSVIPLSRIGNGRLNAAHPPFCAYDHLHAATPAGIVIADGAGGTSGLHVDPEPGSCGYGEIITVLTPVPTAQGRR